MNFSIAPCEFSFSAKEIGSRGIKVSFPRLDHPVQKIWFEVMTSQVICGFVKVDELIQIRFESLALF